MEIEELSAKVDSYVAAREARLAKQRETDKLEETEKELKQLILTSLRENKSSAIGGTTHVITLITKNQPTVTNWAEVYAYVKENDAFDLLQRRLNEAAVTTRWEDKITIPGVGSFPVDKLSISKR